MNLSLLQGRYNPAIISFILLSSLIGKPKPLFASPGEHERHPVRNHAEAPVIETIAHSSWTTITVTTKPSNSVVLTCANPSATITASTSASGTTTYRWTGPNSFTATGSSITVSTVGTYTVTGTNSGKTGSASCTVTSNKTPPPTMTPGNTGPLTCSNTSASLIMPFGDGTGLTVIWTGPNGFTSTDAFPAVSVPGTYALVATYTATGCSTSNPTIVEQDITAPANLLMTSNPNTVLTCSRSSIAFTASSSVSGASYSWTGPNGFTATGLTTSVSAPGTYALTATDPNNGCTATASSVVTQNTTAPGGVATTALPATAQITCTNPTVVLTGSSNTTGVTYGWSGPGIVSASGASATVNVDGTYTVTVTDPANGCTSTLSSSVTKNVSSPLGLSASASDIISCFQPTITLQGRSTTPNATFAWSGPGGYTANIAEPETSTPGNYTLTVTNTNGCSASAGTTVLADTATPANVTASNNGPLTCTTTGVTISSSSSTSGVDFTWVTPSNTFISGATAVVTDPGTYTIQVTNNGNGCSSQATTTVIRNCPGSNAVTAGTSSGRTAEGFNADALTGFVYKTYPNPSSSTAFLEFASPVSTPVKVEVYTSTGTREQQLFNSTANANQVYKLRLAGLSSGTHFCVISNNGKVYTTKIVFVK